MVLKLKKLKLTTEQLRQKHYDIFGGARLLVRVGIDDREQPLDLAKHLFHAKR